MTHSTSWATATLFVLLIKTKQTIIEFQGVFLHAQMVKKYYTTRI